MFWVGNDDLLCVGNDLGVGNVVVKQTPKSFYELWGWGLSS